VNSWINSLDAVFVLSIDLLYSINNYGTREGLVLNFNFAVALLIFAIKASPGSVFCVLYPSSTSFQRGCFSNRVYS